MAQFEERQDRNDAESSLFYRLVRRVISKKKKVEVPSVNLTTEEIVAFREQMRGHVGEWPEKKA